jgi:hypothetical protein
MKNKAKAFPVFQAGSLSRETTPKPHHMSPQKFLIRYYRDDTNTAIPMTNPPSRIKPEDRNPCFHPLFTMSLFASSTVANFDYQVCVNRD